MSTLYIVLPFSQTTQIPPTISFSETKTFPAKSFFCPRLGFVNEPSPEGSVVDKTGSSPADAPKMKLLAGFAL
jgi:hypothetical protein